MASLAILALLAAAGACKKQAPPGPDVWATVNNKEIKREEVEKYFRSRVGPEGQQPSHEESLSLLLSILDELINNELLLERARKLGLEASDGEVEDKFTESKSIFTEEEFQRQLKERGVTVDDLKRDLRRQLSIQKLFNREVVAKISITDQDVRDFFEQNRAQFNIAEPQFRIGQILVTPRRDTQVRNRTGDDAVTEAEARRKITALLERLNAGTDFAQVAMDYSEDPVTAGTGGDLGYVPESALQQSDPGLRRQLAGMRVGEISGVIASRDGFRILKLLAREAPGQRTLDDPRVQQSIRDALRNRKEQLLRAAFLTTARDEAQVTNYLAKQIIESAGKLPEVAAKPAQGSGAAQPTK
jgi:peptidyl-prolyl cis-trans isomerase SurA